MCTLYRRGMYGLYGTTHALLTDTLMPPLIVIDWSSSRWESQAHLQLIFYTVGRSCLRSLCLASIVWGSQWSVCCQPCMDCHDSIVHIGHVTMQCNSRFVWHNTISISGSPEFVAWHHRDELMYMRKMPLLSFFHHHKCVNTSVSRASTFMWNTLERCLVFGRPVDPQKLILLF